jgi:hypothetical protein
MSRDDHIGPFVPPEPDYTPGNLSPPAPPSGPEPILCQIRMLVIAATALIIAVNALLAGLASMRAGEQVQQVVEATDANRAEIKQISKKTDAMHKEVSETLGGFATPPADDH